MRAMTPPIRVTWGSFLLLSTLSRFCTFACGTRDLCLHSRNTLLHHSFHSLCARVFTPFSPTLFLQLQQEFALSFYFWSFFLTQKRSVNHAPDTGEGRVIGLDYIPKLNGFTDIHIFRELLVRDVLVIYMLLPDRMMS